MSPSSAWCLCTRTLLRRFRLARFRVILVRLRKLHCPRLALSGAEDGVEDGSKQVDSGGYVEHVAPSGSRFLHTNKTMASFGLT